MLKCECQLKVAKRGEVTVRSWLKELRARHGFSQADVAQKLGVSRQAYSFIEAGERQADMNLSLANKLAGLFGVSLEQIREWEVK